VLLYTIVIGNISRAPVPDIVLTDTLPTDTTYVPNSTFFKDAVGVTTPIPDDGSGTAFPLDGSGVELDPLGSLPVGGSYEVTFRVVIDGFANLTPGTTEILNVCAVAPAARRFLRDTTIFGRIGTSCGRTSTVTPQDGGLETSIPGVQVQLILDANGNGVSRRPRLDHRHAVDERRRRLSLHRSPGGPVHRQRRRRDGAAGYSLTTVIPPRSRSPAARRGSTSTSATPPAPTTTTSTSTTSTTSEPTSSSSSSHRPAAARPQQLVEHEPSTSTSSSTSSAHPRRRPPPRPAPPARRRRAARDVHLDVELDQHQHLSTSTSSDVSSRHYDAGGLRLRRRRLPVATLGKVNNDRDRRIANAVGSRIRVAKNVFMTDGTSIGGDLVEVGNASSVFRVYAGKSFKKGFDAVVRDGVFPLTTPIETPYCVAPTFTCGGPDVIVAPGQPVGPLAPGTYGRVIVMNGGSLTLAPGEFTFCDVKMGGRPSSSRHGRG
jgi:uncharacterized repeat protein (TIGR01451 family)